MCYAFQIHRLLLHVVLLQPFAHTHSLSLEALHADLVTNQRAWEGIFSRDTDVVKTSRVAELLTALATIHFQRGNYPKSMMISAKSSEVLIHMTAILEERMPARPSAALAFTDADFPSPSGTFLASDHANVPNEREAWILFERLAFKNNELLLNITLGACQKDLSMFRATRKHVCYALRKLIAWELDYKVGCSLAIILHDALTHAEFISCSCVEMVIIALQANAGDMIYATLLRNGSDKPFKKTSLRKKLSAMTDDQLEAMFMELLRLQFKSL